MKVAAWYLFVVIGVILLVCSFLYHNYFLTFISFVIAMILNKYMDKIPLPKYFRNLKASSKNKQE